ncbi:MAG: helix-turn-helix domain-containing protein [Candidatus Kapabacteria bacterium]|nr:helix-turn-helix domain-containing protein [Candidatus Kapabacteria bacterium]
MPIKKGGRLITIAEAAQYAGIAESRLMTAVKAGELRVIREQRGGKNYFRTTKECVEQWLDFALQPIEGEALKAFEQPKAKNKLIINGSKLRLVEEGEEDVA